MCTLTVIATRDDRGLSTGYRLVTNRDESRARPPALKPARRRAGEFVALWPQDPVGGGTWIGVNEAGLTLSILNGNPRPFPELPAGDMLRSRGVLVPELLRFSKAVEAADALMARSASAHSPFRLVAVDSRSIIDVVWNGASLLRSDRELAPVCFASSGLGDTLVQPRLPLFESMLAELGETVAFQDRFHAHQWPDRPEISVWMEREEARTVSRTIVDVRHHDAEPTIWMTHEQGDEKHALSLGATKTHANAKAQAGRC